MAVKEGPSDETILRVQSRGVQRVQSTIHRYFASNATRSQLPRALVDKLESIRMQGNEVLNLVEPYQNASVFSLAFAQQLEADVDEGEYPGTANLSSQAIIGIRQQLDRAASEFMEDRFVVFPFDDQDLETTSAVSAFIFLGAVARYCPEVIFESIDDSAVKKELAERFLSFYQEHIARFMPLDTAWDSAPSFHGKCFESYNAFKEQLPELFDMLRMRISTSQGELMAPYGSGEYSTSWLAMHYKAVL